MIGLYIKNVIKSNYKYEGEDYKKFILKNDLSVVGLLFGSHSTFAEDWNQKPWVKQVAKALNLILIEEFDNLKDFYNKLGVDRKTIEMLWEGKMEPRQQLVNLLIEGYRVDPFTIFNTDGEIERLEREEVEEDPLFI